MLPRELTKCEFISVLSLLSVMLCNRRSKISTKEVKMRKKVQKTESKANALFAVGHNKKHKETLYCRLLLLFYRSCVLAFPLSPPPAELRREVQTVFFAYWAKTAEFPGRNKMVHTGIPHLIPRGEGKASTQLLTVNSSKNLRFPADSLFLI